MTNRRPGERGGIRYVEIALLSAGFVCLTIFGGWWLQGKIYQSYQSYALDRQMRGQETTILGYVEHLFGKETEAVRSSPAAPEAPEDQAVEPAPRLPRPPRNGLIGRIEIPVADVSVIVREGADDATLSRAAGHIPDTALPGEPGNVGIAAHRDSHFRGLRNLEKGDEIVMTTTHGKFTYVVESTKIVKPGNVEVLDPTPQPAITLVTCYPFYYVGHAPKRFIVRARQVSPEVAFRKASNRKAAASGL